MTAVTIRDERGKCLVCGGKLRTGRFYCSYRCIGISRRKPGQRVVEPRVYGLTITPKLNEVLRIMETEITTSVEIAEKLGITPKAVKQRVSRLLAITGCNNRTKLIIWHLTRNKKNDIF